MIIYFDRWFFMKQFFWGEVVHPISLYQKNDLNAPEFLKKENRDLAIISYQFYRNILFWLNAQKKILDIYYDTPSYPILNFSNIDEIRTSNIVVQNIQKIELESVQSFYNSYQDLLIPHFCEGNILRRKKEIITPDMIS